MSNHSERAFTFGYLDLTKISGLSTTAVYKHVSRGYVDLNDFESVVLWCIKYARDDFRASIVSNLVRMDLHLKGRSRKVPTKKKKPKRGGASD